MIDLFEEQGIVFPIRVLSDQEVREFRDELEVVAGDSPRRMDQLHMRYEWAYRLASHENVLDAVEKLIGPEILIDGNLVFYKPPHDEGYASWHQDSVYSGWHLTPSVSAWIALTVSEPCEWMYARDSGFSQARASRTRECPGSEFAEQAW